MKTGKIQRFGAFRLDRVTGTLLRGDESVALAPQPMRLLELLVDRAGGLVAREEIQAHLWPDRVVDFERGMHFCVAQVRGALGETAADARIVRTVPGRGYRLGVPVETDAPGRTRRMSRARPALAAAVAVLAVALTAWAARPTEPVQRIQVTQIAGVGVARADALAAAIRAELDRRPGIAVVDDGAAWKLHATLTDAIDPDGLRLDASVADADGHVSIDFELEIAPGDLALLAEDVAHEVTRAVTARRSRHDDVEMEIVRRD